MPAIAVNINNTVNREENVGKQKDKCFPLSANIEQTKADMRTLSAEENLKN